MSSSNRDVPPVNTSSPIVVEFHDLFPFGALELRRDQVSTSEDPRPSIDGRAGVYVWGFVFPERPHEFLPYYVGKHETSVLYRLAEHVHCGIPYGTHTLFSPTYLKDPARVSGGFKAPLPLQAGETAFKEDIVFPKAIRRVGRSTAIDDSCEACHRVHCKTCPDRREAAEFYRKHFHACAYLMPRRTINDRRSTPPYPSEAVGDLERVVKAHYPQTLGHVTGSADESMFTFGDGGFPYPARTPMALRRRAEESQR